jgi:hypothetical protein
VLKVIRILDSLEASFCYKIQSNPRTTLESMSMTPNQSSKLELGCKPKEKPTCYQNP